MPQLAGAAAAWAVTAWTSAVTVVNTAMVAAAGAALPGLSFGAQLAVANFATKAAVFGGLAAASAALMRPNIPSSGSSLDFKPDPKAPIRGAMGYTALGGNKVFQATWGYKRVAMSLGVALSLGPIDQVPRFEADGATVTFSGAQNEAIGFYAADMWQRTTLGLPGDAALLPPTGLKYGNPGLTGWGTQHAAPQVSFSFWTMVLAKNPEDRDVFTNGVPDPRWIGRWMKLWDPRKDSTYPGGSGPQRRDDWRTWEWSESPYVHALAWCRGHYKLNLDGTIDRTKRIAGIGAPDAAIDIPAFVEGMNVAQANDWTISGEWSTSDGKFQTLLAMLQAGGGEPISRGAQISVMVNAPRVATYPYTRDDLIGQAEIRPLTPRRERKNTIVPRYKSEANGWQYVPAGEVTSSVYRDEDRGEPRSLEIEYTHVRSAKQAGQLAAYDLANLREGLTATLPSKVHLMHVHPGDCITVDVPELALAGQKFVVRRATVNHQAASVTLELRSESDGKHAWALGQAAQPAPSPSLSAVDPKYVPPPAPEDWTAVPKPPGEGGVSQPIVIIELPIETTDIIAVIIKHGPSAAGPWTDGYEGSPRTDGRYEVPGLTPGQTYCFSLQYVAKNGAKSDPDIKCGIVAGDLIAGDTTHLKGHPVQDILDNLTSTATLADQNRQAVEELEEVYGDTASAAASAAAAAASEAAAVQAKADAIIAKGEAQDARDEAAQKALDASGSAAASAGSASAADDARAAAVIAKGEAQGAAADAAADALVAAQKAGEALGSANSAAGSAAVASTKADEAGTAAAASLASSVTATTAKDAALAAAIAGFPDVLAPDLLTSSRNRSPEDAPSLNPAWFSAEGITSPVSAQAEVYYKQTVPWKSGEVYEFDFEVEGITGVSSAAVLGPYQNAANTNVTTRSGPYVVTPNGVKTRIVQRIALDRTLAGATTWPLGTWNADRLRFGVAVNALTGGDANPRQARLTRMTVRNVTALVAAEKVRDDTILLGGNQGFEEGLTGWGRSYTTTQPPITTWQSSYEGRSGVVVTEGGPRAQHFSAKLFDVDPARKYRFRSSVFVGAGAPSRIYAGFRNLDADGQPTSSNSGAKYVVWGGQVLPENSGWVDRVSDIITGEGALATNFAPGTRKVQLLVYLNYDQAAETQTALDGVWIEDVTESVDAQTAAAASATSAASAAASETAAGQFASAADTSRQQAQTARAGAEAAQSSAADSATTATGAAATATQQAGLATTAKNASETAAQASVDARDQAASFADDAEVSASASSAASVTAVAARQAAEAAQGASEDARDQSQSAATASAGSATSAAASETAAGQSASAANTAKTQAETARGQAQAAATQAADSRDTAEGHAASASASAGLAADSRDAAAGSASAAAGSAATADTKAGEAGVSAAAAQAASVSATTAKEAAEDARDDAEASASASASSASSAAASETASGQSASAAQSARIDAETARAQAQTFRNEAADAATDAEGSAATAASAASQSVTAKDQAQGFANAANTSAQNAAGSATASGNSAAAANTAKTAAEAAYGGAVGAAIATMPDVIAADLLTRASTGSPETRPDLPSGVSGGTWTTGPSDSQVYFKAAVPWVQGRIYEYSMTVEGLTEATAGGVPTSRLFFQSMNPDYSAKATGSPVGNTPIPIGAKTVLKARAGFGVSGVSGVYTIAGVDGDWVRFGALVDRVASGSSKAPGATSRVSSLSIRDVTGEVNADRSAAASATSAASAAASATQAGEEAIAAQVSATAADTSRGQAQTAATQASEAETNAAGSAATASTAAQNAADSRDQASGFATAASGSASTASTKATEAGNAAAAAQASQVSASAAKEAAEDARDDAETAKGQAQASATASATQASNAAASATTAGEKATAAAGSATTAATKAGEASSFANQAAGSASDAAGAAVTASQASGTSVSARDAAIGARNDAQAAAATSVAQSSAATAAAAEAKLSANLAAQVGGGAMNLNPTFTDWSSAFPAGWGNTNAANTTYTKVAGLNGMPNALRAQALANTSDFSFTIVGAATDGEWVAYEADFTLEAGGLNATGVTFSKSVNDDGSGNAGNINVAFRKQSSGGVVIGDGVVGQTYRVRGLIDARGAGVKAYNGRVRHYITSFGTPRGLPTITWHKVLFRPATPQEVAAGTVLPAVEAQLAIVGGVAADAADRLSTVRFDVTGGAGGDPFQIWGRAGPDGSVAGMVASELSFSTVVQGLVVKAMRLIGGDVFVINRLYVGPNKEIEIEPFTPAINWTMGGARLAIGKLANDNLLFWFGPNVTPANMRKSNAALWLDRAGGAYFGGALSAGTLTNKAATTSLSFGATTETARFNSHGGTITVTLSLSGGWNKGYWNSSSLPAATESGNVVVTLYRSVNGGAFSPVVTLPMTYNWSRETREFEPGLGWQIVEQGAYSGSLTYTDPQTSTQDRQYRATITTFSPITQTGIMTSQNLSIIAVE